MEDFRLDIVVGKGPGARAIRLGLPAFTLVGATTRTGLVTAPLRDRFGFAARLDYYEAADLASIVRRSAGLLDVRIEAGGRRGGRRPQPGDAPHREPAAAAHARLRRGARRRCRHRRRCTRGARAVRGSTSSDWTRLDRQVLGVLCRDYRGGPVGLSTLAVAVGEETETVEDVVEPFLIQQGLLGRTPRGRIATAAAWSHLGLTVPTDERDPSLFG